MRSFSPAVKSHALPLPLIREAEGRGFKFLGSGEEKTGFLSPDGDVVLVFYSPSASNDRPALSLMQSWVDFCNSHSSPHLPRFKSGIESSKSGRATIFQVRCEPLSKPDVFCKKVADILFELSIRSVLSCVTVNDVAQVLRGEGQNVMARELLSVDKKFPQLIPTFLLIAKSTPRQHRLSSLDMNRDNIMLRGSVPVFTDPWSCPT